MSWYEEWFGKEYLELYRHRDIGEAKRFLHFLMNTISIPPGASVLDLCCGGGRYSVLLAQAGFSVTGVDLSADLLESAGEYSKKAGVAAEFIQCDMRKLDYQEQFDLVLNMFTSFGYFQNRKDDETVLRNAFNALKPNGYFVLDFLNSSQVIRSLKPCSMDEKKGYTVIQKRSLTAGNKRVEKEITLIKDGVEKSFTESVRLYSPAELKMMLTRAGFSAEYQAGSYPGDVLTEHSERAIFINRKV